MKMNWKPIQRTREEYKLDRNKYVRVRRKEKKGYEKDIIDKCNNKNWKDSINLLMEKYNKA